jgi:hypothetical protein
MSCPIACDFCVHYAYNGEIDQPTVYCYNGMCEHPEHMEQRDPWEYCGDFMCKCQQKDSHQKEA